MEKPYSGRAVISETANDITIEIPSKKKWYTIIFMSVWLVGWLIGEVLVLAHFTGGLNGPEDVFVKPFLLVWLTVWSVAGFFAFRTLLWMIAGKEIISIDSSELRVRKKALLFNKPKIYDIKEVKDFAVAPNYSTDNFFANSAESDIWGMGKSGALKFDYGLRTIKLAAGIDEAEAKYLLNIVKAKSFLSE